MKFPAKMRPNSPLVLHPFITSNDGNTDSSKGSNKDRDKGNKDKEMEVDMDSMGMRNIWVLERGGIL
jgi:hypothetical protein